MCFTKNFKFTKVQGLILINTEELNDYLHSKIEFFSNTNNYGNKDEILNLINDILEMCEYDKKYATFDFPDLNDIKAFHGEEIKKNMIYYYNFVLILGKIYYHVFDKPGNRIVYVEEGKNGPISTGNMFIEAYNELIYKKKIIDNAYGATLIFATLIEKDLKTKIKNILVQDYLEQLQKKIDNKEASLNREDTDLFLYLKSEYQNGEKAGLKFDGFRDSTEYCYNLFKRYDIINSSDNESEKIIKNEITLGKLKESSFLKKSVDERFLRMIDILFSTKKMNLRNNLAHCNFGYANYFNINATALLYGVFSIIALDMFLRKT